MAKINTKKTKYLFQKYPAYRYFKGEQPVIVHDEKQDEEYLSQGWEKTPKNSIMETIKEVELEGIPMEEIEDVVDNVAAITNMLLRVPKVRSKKDLRWLAEELDIDLEGRDTLKTMKAHILEQAKINNLPGV